MKKLSIILAAACVMTTTPVLASGGGYSGGGSGGGFSSSRPRDPYAAAFSKGKKAFKKRITCKKCEYKGGVNDSKTARAVAVKVKAGQFNLKTDQRRAVLFYLSERYSIKT